MTAYRQSHLVQKNNLTFLQPDWPVADHVHAIATTRTGGVSDGLYKSFNLAQHVEDDAQRVALNRQCLSSALDLPQPPAWLSQVHSDVAVCLPHAQQTPIADAAYTAQADQVCVVMTADCLPVLVSDHEGSWVAAIHAGWRGLASHIISKTLACYPGDRAELAIWLGPAISAKHYEVGAEVYRQFLDLNTDYQAAFCKSRAGHYSLDVYQAARTELGLSGFAQTQVYGGGACTYSDTKQFYSYRRDGAKTGRMASLIWLAG